MRAQASPPFPAEERHPVTLEQPRPLGALLVVIAAGLPSCHAQGLLAVCGGAPDSSSWVFRAVHDLVPVFLLSNK